MSRRSGTRIGRYEIRALLGAGGMGEVYRAVDIQLGREVALKFLPAEVASEERWISRFVQEARATSALNHPNILTVYDIEQTDAGEHFFAAELVAGETLRELLRRGPMKPRDALEIAVQVASALAAAHADGIVHRDIKPENVMIRRDGYVKVLDFGLAKLKSAVSTGDAATRTLLVKTELGAVVGTVAYMSPEQARGEEVDARTDLWSLGVVLYEMLTGQLPFRGESPNHTIVAILDDEPPPLARYLPYAPDSLQEIVSDALAKDRDARFQTAKQMLAKLRRLKQQLDRGLPGDRAVRAGSDHGIADAAIRAAAPAAVDAPEAASSGSGSGTRSGGAAVRGTHAPGAEHSGGESRFPARTLVVVSSLALVVITAAVVVVSMRSSRGDAPPPDIRAPLRVTPLTTDPGFERNPAFSPDGRRIAYVSAREGNFELYVQIIGAGAPLRLTTTRATEMSPAWSPDGDFIAFLRSGGEEPGVWVIPAMGGVARRLMDAHERHQLGAMPQALDWSPDGSTLAVVDKHSAEEPWGVFLISVETGEKRRLTEPPAGYNGDLLVAFSPDGSRLAYARTRALRGDIYVMGLGGGEPTRITSEDMFLEGLAWARDGKSLVFTASRSGGSATLWKVPLAGGAPAAVAGVGTNITDLAVSPQGDRLAYAHGSGDVNIYGMELRSDTRARNGSPAPVPVIASTQLEWAAQFSRDGRKIAFVSDRSGAIELWMSDGDGKDPVQLTDFRGAGPTVGTPSWSPDDRFIAFTVFSAGNADIFVVSAQGGAPRPLTSEPTMESAPSWSNDQRWVYFTSNRTGRDEVWKMPAAGGAAVRLTHQGGTRPVEAVGGGIIYYWRGGAQSGVWGVPVAGGDETPVFAAILDAHNWAAVKSGIYFLSSRGSPPLGQPRYTLEFFDFSRRRRTPIMGLGPRRNTDPRNDLLWNTFRAADLTVSLDEQRMLYTQRDRLEIDLMLVENFR